AFCENGAALSKISIEVVAPLSTTAASSFVTANGSSMPFSVKVHSGLRVASVTVKTAADIASLAGATAVNMALSGPAETSPTIGTGPTPAPGTGAPMATELPALDEQFLPSLGNGGANAAHFDTRQLTANITPVPTATASGIGVTLGGTPIGSGTAC